MMSSRLVRDLYNFNSFPESVEWVSRPRQWQIIRAPFPENIENCQLVFKDREGTVVTESSLVSPIGRHGNKYVTYFRRDPEIVDAEKWKALLAN
jgi:hypothetical protein